MYTTFFIYLLEVSICSILLFGFYQFVLKNDNFFQANRMYLIGSVIFSFFVPAIHINVNPETFSKATALFLGLDELVIGAIEAESPESEYIASIDYSKVVFLIYCLGSLFFTLKLLINIKSIYKIISTAEIEQKNGYKIAYLDTKLPVFSFFNYIFWSKDSTYEDHEIEQIIKHEQVHIKQRHSVDLLFLEIVNIVLWFNPFIYLFKRNLKNIHEYIADQDLFEKQNYHHKYLDLLIKESKHGQNINLPVVHTFYNNQFKKRLIMIKNNNRHSNKLKIVWCLPLITALVLCFSFENSVIAQGANNETSNPESGNIYVVTDTKNSFTVKDDGSQRTPDEIKQHIIATNKREGKTVTEDQIHLISKEEMNRNLNMHNTPKAPIMKWDFRIVYVEGGKLMVFDMNEKKSNKQLKVISFTASIQKAKSIGAKKPLDFTTFTLNHQGNKLNKAALEMIDSIDKNLLVKSFVSFSDIIVEKNGDKFTLDKTAKFDLKL